MTILVCRVVAVGILLSLGAAGACATRTPTVAAIAAAAPATASPVTPTPTPTPKPTPTTATASRASATAIPPRPRLLVTIVVDQLAAWIAAERWPTLPDDGGFARLRREGLYVRQLRYDHAVTDTAPGHSALYTGAVPRVSGIIGNEIIIPRASGAGPAASTAPAGIAAMASILADPNSRLVVTGLDAPTSKTASSLAALAVDTLADVLARGDSRAAIFSFSLKDRGALFGAGRHPTLALWFDPAAETFVTSTAFATTVPAWVTPLGGRDAVRAACAAGWSLLDRDWVAAHSLTADNQPGEGDFAGLGVTFPHRISSAQALRATPAGDDLVLAMARGAVARLAPAGHPTLLALSLSSNDYIGHVFGPDSWEAWDQLRRLDQKLAAFLAFLDGAVGADAYAVMLTGDHGIGALPELAGAARDAACRRRRDNPGATSADATTTASCAPGQRLLQDQIAAALEQIWQGAPRADAGIHGTGDSHDSGSGAVGPWVAGIADPLVFLTARARALPSPERARLVQASARSLRDRFGIDDVVDIRAATGPCPPSSDQSRAALVCRSLRPDGPADLYLVVKPGTFFDARYTPGHGVHHGSPYLYDRAVPLLVRAPGRIAAATVREDPVAFTAFVRTAAALLSLPAPATAGEGEDLTAPTPAPR